MVISEIYSHAFLAKLSWKQCFYYYVKKLLKRWFDEIFFGESKFLILPHCDQIPIFSFVFPAKRWWKYFRENLFIRRSDWKIWNIDFSTIYCREKSNVHWFISRAFFNKVFLFHAIIKSTLAFTQQIDNDAFLSTYSMEISVFFSLSGFTWNDFWKI